MSKERLDEQRERERASFFQMVFLLLIKKWVVVHAQECVVVGDLLLDWTPPTTTIEGIDIDILKMI